ncbi:tryptophan dimethylallyltransferase family protein [Embleya sp. NPDC127516]|uniref:tryptophan dimethylallyltransferase family protein n=1 Tax=Embleya sp. NPDC127516 TaxID=3363990 RepID=UPI0038037958
MTLVVNPYEILSAWRAAGRPATLGSHVRGQLDRLCRVTGVADPERRYADSLTDLLGTSADRPLGAPPAWPSFVSDDHTPAEFSVTVPRGGPPSVRVLTEPGCGAATLAGNSRSGWAALRRLAGRWEFSLEPLRRVETLFFPAAPQGAFALWCAMELRAHEGPGFKAYVNPGAHGPGPAAEVVDEAMARFGYARAWAAVRAHVAARRPDDDRFAFVGVDLGSWAAPRVKVYVAHHRFDLDGVRRVAGLYGGGCPEQVVRFSRVAGATNRFDGRPLLSCLSFNGGPDTCGPTGYTLHLPVRDYVGDDACARDRAASVLRDQGLPTALLDRALGAVSRRRPADGVGLISYLSLVQAAGHPPRVTAYLSSEAYRVGAPRTQRPRPEKS